MSLDALGGGDDVDIMDSVMDGMIYDLPALEVDGSSYDPAATRHISRIAHPILLTIIFMPNRLGAPAGGLFDSTNDGLQTPPNLGVSDPVDCQTADGASHVGNDHTHTLVLVLKGNFAQVEMNLGKTKWILHMVLAKTSRERPLPTSTGGGSSSSVRSRCEMPASSPMRTMQAILRDL
jgi:hypothetical protein